LNQARAGRLQRPGGNAAQEQPRNAQEQPRQAGSAAGQPTRGSGTASGGVASSDSASAGLSSGTSNQVIQFPVGGGKQGFKELFGNR
jgi:hypothetical protein